METWKCGFFKVPIAHTPVLFVNVDCIKKYLSFYDFYPTQLLYLKPKSLLQTHILGLILYFTLNWSS